MSSIKIFDPAVVSQTIEQLGSGSITDLYSNLSGPEGLRLAYLAKLACDARGGLRDVLVASSRTVERLGRLADQCPNLEAAIGIIRRAAELSRKTRTEVRLPPLLLLGPPGVGKTHFARRVAAALGTSCIEHSMTGADDTLLTGHSLSWRGARAGAVARALIEGETASPLIFIDELDKAQSVGHATDLLDPLHSLLEPENARAFVDTYLELPLRADRVLWIATANETSHIKRSLLDRFVVLEIDPPTTAQRRIIIQTLYAKAVGPFAQSFAPDLSDDAAAALAEATPRRMRMLLEIALGYAFSDKRRCLAVSDIHAAQKLLEGPVARPRIGFTATGL